MHYMKPEQILNFFHMFTKPTSTVEFTVNDTNAVVMMVSDNDELTAATVISVHENAADANTAKGVYEAAFKMYRETMTTQETEMNINEKVKIGMTLENAIAFANSTAAVNEKNEVLITMVRNGVTETKVFSSHATAEEAQAEKAEHEKMVADFKSQVAAEEVTQ
ncbi:hypothetical protein M977_04340 [Buttiauxella gaviniae ATCC 51604]|uniref:Uncharacterized protein n=1 Tax=Buttiauxella gaviniae ATCC 51604 TaxID=1354253 RepID=A0A1B7HN63_9ENTR|nr:hypothetical protein [Buttiauxella gaviniae]OAT17094.1 hypothetical protein M977_04340 [Buttiauxella gaviniae ATCC 51604]